MRGSIWSGDLPGDDLPYHVNVESRPLVVMPRLDYANDLSLIFRPEELSEFVLRVF